MNYVKLSYLFVLLILKVHISITESHEPIDVDDSMVYKNVIDIPEDLDENEIQIELEQAIIDEKHRSWKACLASDRPRTECNALYESMLREEKPLTRIKHYHAMLEEHPDVYKNCRKTGRSKDECKLEKEDRESRLSIMEKELHPWKEIHDLCIAALPQKKCDEIFEELQIPRFRHLVPESLVTLAKVHICLDVGRSEEDCQKEAEEHFTKIVQSREEL